MAKKKKEPLDQTLQIPVGKTLKRDIEAEANTEERTVAEMGRRLWREALKARKELVAADAD